MVSFQTMAKTADISDSVDKNSHPHQEDSQNVYQNLADERDERWFVRYIFSLVLTALTCNSFQL